MSRQNGRDLSQEVSLSAPEATIAWLRILPYVGLHLACFAVIWVGVSWPALIIALLSYLLRAFAISAFYHRGFSHRAFSAGRGTQMLFAVLGAAATQRGPLWWAAHHRRHHRHADTTQDPHSSPRGFWWSHMAWFLTEENYRTPLHIVRDLAKFSELRWLDRYDLAIPVGFACSMYLLGEFLHLFLPQTNGWQILVWGYFVSTVALMHVTFLVNSISHRFGERPFETKDRSRNLPWLAVISMGEGWHNNHHRYASAARLGFFPGQLDLGYLGLRLLERCGLVKDLKLPPHEVLQEGQP